jgi:hypothetical protein
MNRTPPNMPSRPCSVRSLLGVSVYRTQSENTKEQVHQQARRKVQSRKNIHLTSALPTPTLPYSSRSAGAISRIYTWVKYKELISQIPTRSEPRWRGVQRTTTGFALDTQNPLAV